MLQVLTTGGRAEEGWLPRGWLASGVQCGVEVHRVLQEAQSNTEGSQVKKALPTEIKKAAEEAPDNGQRCKERKLLEEHGKPLVASHLGRCLTVTTSTKHGPYTARRAGLPVRNVLLGGPADCGGEKALTSGLKSLTCSGLR